jgi:hypothetical protein
MDFFYQGAPTRGTDKDLKALRIKVFGQEQKGRLASAEGRPVDHLANSYLFHRFAKLYCPL